MLFCGSHMQENIVSNDTMKEVREASDSQDTRFLVISYDLPSERRAWHTLSDEEEEERQKELKANRQRVFKKAKLLGMQLSQSVYIVRADLINNIIEKIDELYQDEEVREYVNVNIVGNSYKHVVSKLLLDYLEEKVEELANELEILEQEIKYVHEDEDTSPSALKRRLWNLSSDVRPMERRVEDLEEIDEDKAEEYEDKVKNLEEKRKALLGHANFD